YMIKGIHQITSLKTFIDINNAFFMLSVDKEGKDGKDLSFQVRSMTPESEYFFTLSVNKVNERNQIDEKNKINCSYKTVDLIGIGTKLLVRHNYYKDCTTLYLQLVISKMLPPEKIKRL